MKLSRDQAKNISCGSLVGKGGLEKTYDKYLRGEYRRLYGGG